MLPRRIPWLLLLLPLLQSLNRRNRSYRYQRSPALQSQKKLPIQQKTGPCAGKISINATGICPLHVNQTHGGLARHVPIGAWLDICSLGSLQLTISHDLVVGEVWYEYQSWVIIQVSLQLPQFEPLEPSDSPPRIQELRVNTMPFLPPISDSTTPQLLNSQKVTGNALWIHLEWSGTLDQVTLQRKTQRREKPDWCH